MIFSFTENVTKCVCCKKFYLVVEDAITYQTQGKLFWGCIFFFITYIRGSEIQYSEHIICSMWTSKKEYGRSCILMKGSAND